MFPPLEKNPSFPILLHKASVKPNAYQRQTCHLSFGQPAPGSVALSANFGAPQASIRTMQHARTHNKSSSNSMASLSCALYLPIKCSSIRDNGSINNTPQATSALSVQRPSVLDVAYAVAFNPATSLTAEQIRQSVPKEKQLTDPFRQGLIVEGGVRYRQTVVIRSYEVGPDKTATLETILNLLQETALNHVWLSGLLGDGFGATHGMMRNNLIWVVTRMHVLLDEYPIWGEVVEIDTWVGASGKNGMRRDWLLRSRFSGQVFCRATSTWVMMNQQTRRLSKMPEEVRDEISPWFTETRAVQEEALEKIDKLDDNAKYVNSNLKPKWNDLDMNHHVNNVKYVRWMLETIPDEFMEDHQLSSIVLEYRRECDSSDTVQSICEPDEDSLPRDKNIILTGFSLAPEILDGGGLLGTFEKWPTRYTHLLQIKGEKKDEEIVRGKTTWRRKKKKSLNSFH